MRVTGPAWPSTAALTEALAGVPSSRVLTWGQSTYRGYAQMVKLAEGGIPVPPHTRELATAQQWATNLAVLGRRDTHTQGRDIVPHRDRKNKRWRSRDYWTVYMPLASEYRVHVFDGATLLIGQKVFEGEEPVPEPVIRSRRLGWHLRYLQKNQTLTSEQRSTAKELSESAVAALGMLWGAVDLGLTENGEWVVLEVNAAPALLNERTLAAYVKAITKWATSPMEVSE